MKEWSSLRVATAVVGSTLWLSAGAGFAAAEPDLNVFVNTTCSYPQVSAALNAQDSAAASQFNGSPMLQGYLRQFLAGAPDQRQRMAAMIAGAGQNQQYVGLMQQVFATCNNY